MPTKTRLANKTQWAIMDTIERCKRAKKTWEQAMKMAESNMDPRMLHLLARLRDDIAEIERIQRLAARGEYEQDNDEEEEDLEVWK